MPELLAEKDLKVDSAVFCKGCWLYQDKQEIAEAIDIIYGQGENCGIWDFAQCYRSCENRFERRRLYDLEKSRGYYKKTKG